MQDKIMRKLNLLMNLIIYSQTNQMVTKKSNLLPNFQLSTTEEFLSIWERFTNRYRNPKI